MLFGGIKIHINYEYHEVVTSIRFSRDLLRRDFCPCVQVHACMYIE